MALPRYRREILCSIIAAINGDGELIISDADLARAHMTPRDLDADLEGTWTRESYGSGLHVCTFHRRPPCPPYSKKPARAAASR
jgi:hypothetical protein